jgi:hypothetical protein
MCFVLSNDFCSTKIMEEIKKETEVKIIPLESIKHKLVDYEEKKEEYKLRHYLYYHVIRKKKVNTGIKITKDNDNVTFD